MLRTVILAGLIYGFYVTGHVAFLFGAFATLHIVQEAIISSFREDNRGVIQQLRSIENDKGQDETETH